MVQPLREWYLPPTGLYPTNIHHLLAQTQLACQSLTPSIDIHSCQLCRPAITISYTTSSFHKSFPIQNSKEIQDIPAKESEVIFFKKREKEKKREVHSPFQVANYGVQINGKPSIPSIPYPPKTPCSMRPGFGKVPIVGVYRQACSGIPLAVRFVGRDRWLWNLVVQGTQRFRQVRAASCVIPNVLCGLYCLRC